MKFYCQESEVHFSFFLLQLPQPWSIQMQNSRDGCPSLTPLQFADEKPPEGTLYPQICDVLTQPRLWRSWARENQGSFWRRSQDWGHWARAAALPGLSSPPEKAFSQQSSVQAKLQQPQSQQCNCSRWEIERRNFKPTPNVDLK